ncbi:MAG: GDP-mannose 4,6-dehydratase [Planctomycetota bacterium]
MEGCLKDKNFQLVEADIRDSTAMDKVIANGIDIVVHLAARAGVRPSYDCTLFRRQRSKEKWGVYQHMGVGLQWYRLSKK